MSASHLQVERDRKKRESDSDKGDVSGSNYIQWYLEWYILLYFSKYNYAVIRGLYKQ